MRIIGGKHKGHRLAVPSGHCIRPTSDRVRESIFNILAHRAPVSAVEGKRVLDLFAGTGALGLEALSRGARFCQFVDENVEARAAIRGNAETLGVVGMCKIWRRDATKLGRCAPQVPCDLVFIDPPYGKGLGEAALASLVEGQWLSRGAIVVLEESARSEISIPGQIQLMESREYGDTKVLFCIAPAC